LCSRWIPFPNSIIGQAIAVSIPASCVLSTSLGVTYQVSKLPYAVLLDERGIVRAKGLVNSREQLESLFTAKDLGVASIQDFVDQQA
jgi:methylamine dehydrogenase accessory protein MauD